MGVGAGEDPLHPCPSSGCRPPGHLGCDSAQPRPGSWPRFTESQHAPAGGASGPGRLGTHGCRQVGSACRRQASLPACAGARPSWGLERGPPRSWLAFRSVLCRPSSLHLFTGSSPLWALPALDSEPHSLGAVGAQLTSREPSPRPGPEGRRGPSGQSPQSSPRILPEHFRL